MALIEEFDKTGNWLFRYRTYLPLVLYIFATLVIFLDKTPSFSHLDPVAIGFCLAVSFLGLVIRSVAIGYVPRLTSGRNTKKQVAEVLNTEGIYSIVRHPLYLGNFFMWMGIVLYIGSWWFSLTIALVFWLYYERIMFAEEYFLRNKFGVTYLDWAGKTPAFIPRFRQWSRPGMEFSFKNVLKREENGFFAAVLSFAYVDFFKNLVLFNQFKLSLFWIIVTAVSFVIFLVIRFIRKKTSLLKVQGR
ncbi:MAG: isoprenylcysteine carboxylmethyltransferase family protein [Bacteroidetes bacterium]|nr:isoprenylcysteine carboxylmethyltransferase family protein [Bacteroidota bacterium]